VSALNNILKHPSKIEEPKPEVEQKPKETIELPNDWWYSQNSYNIKPEIKPLNLVQIDSVKHKRKLPKPNYWQISQGDYLIKEKYKCVSETVERKRKFVKYAMYPAMLLCAYIVWYMLRFFVR
jgi:hypothetical protein